MPAAAAAASKGPKFNFYAFAVLQPREAPFLTRGERRGGGPPFSEGPLSKLKKRSRSGIYVLLPHVWNYCLILIHPNLPSQYSLLGTL